MVISISHQDINRLAHLNPAVTFLYVAIHFVTLLERNVFTSKVEPSTQTVSSDKGLCLWNKQIC